MNATLPFEVVYGIPNVGAGVYLRRCFSEEAKQAARVLGARRQLPHGTWLRQRVVAYLGEMDLFPVALSVVTLPRQTRRESVDAERILQVFTAKANGTCRRS